MAKRRKRTAEIHPLVTQLRFTRAEFLRTIKGVTEKDARRRLLPMNCLSWNVGHLAWQEQRYFLGFGLDVQPYPDIAAEFTTGGPASTPTLARVLRAWHAITTAADPWLYRLTTDSARFEAERPRRRRLLSIARHENDRVVARERRALLDAHGEMYCVKGPQAMLDDQAICRGKDQIRPQADRADRSTLSEIH